MLLLSVKLKILPLTIFKHDSLFLKTDLDWLEKIEIVY